MVDTLASRGIIGVMTPAMNTVVQPELELLRPQGVTNQMQRFRLGGDKVSDDLIDEAEKLMDCHPVALAIGLTTDAGPGGVAKLAARCAELAEAVGIPVCNASEADHAALHALGAKRVAVVTPFSAEVDLNVVATAGGELIEVQGTGEKRSFRRTELDALLDLAFRGIGEIAAAQNRVLAPTLEAVETVRRKGRRWTPPRDEGDLWGAPS